MSTELIKNTEILANDAAQNLSRPIEQFQDALTASLTATTPEATEAPLTPEQLEARYNGYYIRKAVALLQPYKEMLGVESKRLKSAELVTQPALTYPDKGSALIAHRTLLWNRGFPYYPIGQDKNRILAARVATPINAPRVGLYIFNTFEDITPYDESGVYALPTQEEKEFIDGIEQKDGTYVLKSGRTMRRTLNRDSKWVDDISGADMNRFNVPVYLTNLMTVHGKSKEFAKLVHEWVESLPPQKEGSEADPLVMRRLMGQMGLVGSIDGEVSGDDER